MTVSSVGKRLHLGTYAGSTTGLLTGYRGTPHFVTFTAFMPVCDTPCTLYLPPGTQQVQVTGDGIRSHLDVLDVPPNGADVTLRAPSFRALVSGISMLGASFGAMAAGAALIAAGQADSPLRSEAFVTHENGGMIIGGGVLVGAGIAMMTGGIALLASSRGGVASSKPRDPQTPTAKLSIGVGDARLGGTF